MFDKAEIEIPCAGCGSKTKKTVAWLKRNKTLTCACGAVVNIDADQIRREMHKVEKALDQLKRTLKRFGR